MYNEPGFKDTLAAELGLEGILQIYSLLGTPLMAEGGRVGYEGGGLASLTRTVAPARGPQHMGLASFKKRGR